MGVTFTNPFIAAKGKNESPRNGWNPLRAPADGMTGTAGKLDAAGFE
jgi:hypothetical protein